MKLLQSTFLILTLVLIACQSSNNKSALQDEIDYLHSDILKKEYLEAIYNKDQGIRKDKNGNRPSNILDADNLEKIIAYLNTYEYPSKELLGRKAALIPWLVIHHQAEENTEIRRSYFKTLYQAYLDGHIDDGAMSLFLNRLYKSEFKKQFEIASPYMPQEELDQLIKALKLVPPNAN